MIWWDCQSIFVSKQAESGRFTRSVSLIWAIPISIFPVKGSTDLNRDRRLLLTLDSDIYLSSVSIFWLLSFSGWRNGILKLWLQLYSPGYSASLSKKLLTLHCLAHYRWQSKTREMERETQSKDRQLWGSEVQKVRHTAWVSQLC